MPSDRISATQLHLNLNGSICDPNGPIWRSPRDRDPFKDFVNQNPRLGAEFFGFSFRPVVSLLSAGSGEPIAAIVVSLALMAAGIAIAVESIVEI